MGTQNFGSNQLNLKNLILQIFNSAYKNNCNHIFVILINYILLNKIIAYSIKSNLNIQNTG